MPSTTIVDIATGQTTTRPLTVEEQAEYDARQTQAAADLAARQQAEADRAATRTAVAAQVAALAGLSFTALTAAQKQLIVLALLYRAGAIDKNLVVQPLASWL